MSRTRIYSLIAMLTASMCFLLLAACETQRGATYHSAVGQRNQAPSHPGLLEQPPVGTQRNRAGADPKKEAVRERLSNIRTLQANQDYQQALAETQQLLFIDPNNQAGLLLNDLLRDTLTFKDYNRTSEGLHSGLARIRPESKNQRRFAIGAFGAERLHNPGATTRYEPGTRPTDQVVEGAPTTRINPEDELWIIVQPDQLDKARPDDEPGSGSLVALTGNADEFVPVPLEHTDVAAHVSGYIASVNVTQRFHNPYSSKIEAVYVFPLPDDAAINGFLMTVGDRTIRGIIKKKEEAEQIYESAKRQGYAASLLTQQRPNIFTQKVANIEPGKAIDIDITYFHTLAYADGWFEYTFPMVIGPRFNPPDTIRDKNAILASPCKPCYDKTQDADVQYLKPDQRSGHDIAIDLTIDAGVPIEAVDCRNHSVDVSEQSPNQLRVTLAPEDTIPNKDFVFRYKVASDDVRQGLVIQPDADGKGGYFTYLMIPPSKLERIDRRPMEMVFVLDCSGSMNGKPIEQAKEAVLSALDHLEPYDTFQIIRFSDNASTFGADPVPATTRNLQRARDYVQGLKGRGGTHMIKGIEQALDFPHDHERLRFVTFLTDGYIGNEAQILDAVEDHLDESRIFSFGVGSSPNRFLMDRMAAIGSGASAYLDLNHEARPTMDLFFDRVSRAALTDVEIDFGSVRASSVYPRRIPDLFVGRPVILTARYEGTLDELDGQPVRIRGRHGRDRVEFTHYIDIAKAHNSKGLDAVWARAHIKELATKAYASNNPDRYDREIEKIALAHSLMSNYTAFVAVDSLTRTDGSYGTTVAMPVPVPEGVRYETTVPGERASYRD